MKKNFVRIFSSNIFIYFLSIFSTIIGFGLNFFLARILEADAYGEVQYQLSIATTISSFLIFGLNSFLIREAKNPKHNGQIIDKVFSFYFCIVVAAIPILFYVLKNFLLESNAFVVIVIFVGIFMGANALVSSYFQGSGKIQISVFFESLVPKLIMFLLALFCLIMKKIVFFQANYMFFYLLIYGAIAIIFICFLFKKLNFNFNKSEITSIGFFFGVTITYSLSTNLTKVLQGGLYDNNVALAIISVCLSMMSVVDVLTGIITTICKPVFAKNYREGNVKENLFVYRLNTRVTSYLAIPIYIFFLTQGHNFLLIFGESYTLYPNIIRILALYSAVACLTGPNGTMLAMTGNEKYELLNGIAYLISFGVFALIFSFDKIYGLCFALLAGQIVVNIAKYIEVWVVYKQPPLDFRTILSMAIIAVVNFACIYFLSYITNFVVWLLSSLTVGFVLIIVNFNISLYRKNDFKSIRNLKVK